LNSAEGSIPTHATMVRQRKADFFPGIAHIQYPNAKQRAHELRNIFHRTQAKRTMGPTRVAKRATAATATPVPGRAPATAALLLLVAAAAAELTLDARLDWAELAALAALA